MRNTVEQFWLSKNNNSSLFLRNTDIVTACSEILGYFQKKSIAKLQHFDDFFFKILIKVQKTVTNEANFWKCIFIIKIHCLLQTTLPAEILFSIPTLLLRYPPPQISLFHPNFTKFIPSVVYFTFIFNRQFDIFVLIKFSCCPSVRCIAQVDQKYKNNPFYFFTILNSSKRVAVPVSLTV